MMWWSVGGYGQLSQAFGLDKAAKLTLTVETQLAIKVESFLRFDGIF